jgi:single-strand DNA-binding protein
MMNQIILVGRLVKDPREERDGMLTLAIPRSYKNADGVYETDFVPCRIWGNMAETTMEYCRKGDIVGVKGRLQSINGMIEVVAEKVTFLSSKSSNNNERDDD